MEALRLLVLVGELGSLGKAAAELGIAQPSASKRVAALERRLGLALVERTRRGSTLTADGQVVVGRSQRVLDELTRALRRAGTPDTRPLLELGSAAAVRGAVIAGTAPAVISELAVGTDIAEGRLVQVSVEGVELRRVPRAVWPAGRSLLGPASDLLAVAARRRE